MNESTVPLAVVTGAAHRIGRAVAMALAGAGYAIGLHYHDSEAEAMITAAEINRRFGLPVYRLRADLANPPEISALFAHVAALPHPLQVLVNSAAVMPRGDLRRMSASDWDAVMDVNLRAPWLCAQAAEGLMEDGGCIINISDSGAAKAWTGYPAYVISKAALEHLTRLLARALAPSVRVNAVAPGLILPSEDLPPEQWDRLVDRLPLRAAGKPEDVAAAVLYLVRAAHVTGQTLAVDGGYQLV